MFRRMEETLSMRLAGVHYEKFVLLSADKCYFRNFNDFINFYEVPLSITDKTNIMQEIKEYFINILSGISSLKPLHLEGFHENTLKYNKEEYSQKVRKILDKFYTPVKIEKELISIFDLKEVTKEEFEIYTKEERSQNMKEGKDIKVKPEPGVFVCRSEKDGKNIYKEITYPSDIKKKYENYICGMVRINTGDFYTDLFLELIDLCSTTALSKNCMVYEAPRITEEQVHVEVALSANNLIHALGYLRNCSSFRSKELYCFDKWNIERRMDMSKIFLERAMTLN